MLLHLQSLDLSVSNKYQYLSILSMCYKPGYLLQHPQLQTETQALLAFFNISLNTTHFMWSFRN